MSGVTAEDGASATVTNAFVELATGLNRWEEEGGWLPAEAQFELLDGAAVARHTAHRVILTSPTDDLPVDLMTPDAQRLTSRVIGISYYSPVTGNSVLIAEPRPTQGQLIRPNQVIYVDCFDGGFHADLRYTLTLAGLEQDLILREQPPLPAGVGLREEPSSLRLELLTEFIQAPEPVIQEFVIRGETDLIKRTQMVEPDFTDQTLWFRSMQIGHGVAFEMDVPHFIPGARVQTGKRWQVIDGRNVLFEAIHLDEAMPFLAELPAMRAAILRKNNRALAASRTKLLPPRKPPQPAMPAPVLLAQNYEMGKCFVLDYSILSSASNFIFSADMTYYVSAETVNLTGTTTIEGGAVLKFTNYPPVFATVAIFGPLNCRTGPARPFVITSKDDNTVGETIPGSSGSPGGTYGGRALLFYNNGTNISLQNVRFNRSYLGPCFYYGSGHELRNVQLVDSVYSIEVYHSMLACRNVLLNNCYWAAVGYSSTVSGENLTLNRLGYQGQDILLNQNSVFSLTNCLLTAVTNVGTYAGSNNATNNNNGSVFQTVGAGDHYLAGGSPYRNAGTANINALLLADLRQKTTWPPIVISNDFTVPTTLSPQAQRDWDLPDLGFHYEPLDFCFSRLNLTNTSLVLTNGVAIGLYGSGGINLRSGAQFSSLGSPGKMNRMLKYHSVQEQTVFWGDATNKMVVFGIPSSNATLPHVQMRFTELPFLAAGYYNNYLISCGDSGPSFLALNDCQLRCLSLTIIPASDVRTMTVSLVNNLLDRGWSSFLLASNSLTPLSLFLRNNLFRDGGVSLSRLTTNGVWEVYDNVFDQTSYSYGASSFPNGTNAYYLTGALPGSDGGDVTLGASPDFVAGPLGEFYYPATGTNLAALINVGSRNATNAGLYHFTTLVNQTKETNSIVDIGFHYVALDGNGNPTDYDADGSPDYYEDADGDGGVDWGETAWQSSADQGLRVLITEPKANATIP